MARLRQARVKLRTATHGVRIATVRAPEGSWQRDAPEERAFLKTAEWQRLRWHVLRRDRFTCQWPGCGAQFAHEPRRLVADHIIPVRVAPERKWDMSNLQCLCDECHRGPKQAREFAVYGIGRRG